MRLRYSLGFGLCLSLPLVLTGDASACSAPPPAATTAFPGIGATEVSPESSIFLVTMPTTIPALVLEENGVALAGPRIELLGWGMLEGTYRAAFWRLSLEIAPPNRTTPLLPASSYVLTEVVSGIESKLTEFTTAAGYDQQPGQAPVLTELRLWRVHYPPDQIGGGSCVFSDHVSYVDLDYQDGSVPGTPAEEVVGVIHLVEGMGQSSFAFAGGHFEGIMEGLGGVPHAGVWNPPLDPDAEYCATMTLYGRNDRAMPAVVSNQICAKVRNVESPSRDPGGCSFPGRPTTSGWVPALLSLLGLALVLRQRRE